MSKLKELAKGQHEGSREGFREVTRKSSYELCQIETSMRTLTFIEWGRMSQVRLMNQFSKEMCSNWDETWSKNQAY